MRKVPFLFLCLVPTMLVADEVYLKGAGTISGQIVEQTEEMVKVNIGDGIMGVPMSRVERIVKARSPLDDYDELAARLGSEDVDGWRKLGRWASKQGMYTQSREAFQKVIASAPDDAEAREALGFVQHEGRWLTEEQAYRAQGYVKVDGEWMTLAEAQMNQASVAADAERRDAEKRAHEAEIDAMQAEARAEEAEERAREAEEDRYDSNPVYWGGWGYGVNYWPSTPVADHRPANRPAQRPGRVGR